MSARSGGQDPNKEEEKEEVKRKENQKERLWLSQGSNLF